MPQIKLSVRSGAGKSSKKRVKVNENLTITEANETKLVEHIHDRFELASQIRDTFIKKIETIDKEFMGHVKLDWADSKRAQDTAEGKGIKPYDVSLPLVDVQIDEAVTLLMSILAPDSDVYGAITTKDKQEIARGVVQRMNEHADSFRHYIELCKFIHTALRYNIAAIGVDWVNVIGRKLEMSETGARNVITDVVRAGNELESFDMYNFLWDVTCPFVKLPEQGEFFAVINATPMFRIKKMFMDQEIWNMERFVNKKSPEVGVTMDQTYYKFKPRVHNSAHGLDSGATDYMSILSQGRSAAGLQHVVEFTKVCIWLDAKEFGLQPGRDNNHPDMDIWELKMVNNKFIVSARRVENAYGMLPVATAMPRDDNFELQTQSQAELLTPYQRFSSFMFNAHQKRTRAAVYGKTFHDSRAVPENVTDTEAGFIPVKLTGILGDADIRKLVHHISDIPESRFALDDIGKVNDFMQKILPTDLLRQVADLQRATEYQAAAVVQGSNRRGHKMAKIIDDQAFQFMRFMQFYNILLHEKTIEITNEQGQLVEQSPAQLADTKVQFSISGGLRGLDKMYMISFYKEMFFALLQSGPENLQRVDMFGMLDYIAGLAGDKMDLTQFEIKQQFDMLTPEQKQIAFGLLQQAQQQQGSGQDAPAGNVTSIGTPA